MNEWMNERTDHKYGDILCPVIDLYCVIAVVSIVVSIARVVGVVYNVGAARACNFNDAHRFLQGSSS